MDSFKEKKWPSFGSWRPVALFLVGTGAFVWQVLFEDADRPYLLALIAGMVGLPFAIVADKIRNQGGEDEDKNKGKS
jgi:hypothetical protein